MLKEVDVVNLDFLAGQIIVSNILLQLLNLLIQAIIIHYLLHEGPKHCWLDNLAICITEVQLVHERLQPLHGLLLFLLLDLLLCIVVARLQDVHGRFALHLQREVVSEVLQSIVEAFDAPHQLLEEVLDAAGALLFG